MAELSQAALEELVEGKPQKPRAVFYEKAALDVTESKAAGKRIYKTRTYVKMIQSGVTDNISYVAKQADFEGFPEEYAYFMQNRQGVTQAVLIDIIPNLNISNKQELIDMGLSTIDRLADAVSVPPHLEHIRQSAIVFQSVLQEQANDHKEESVKEITEEDTIQTHVNSIEGEVMPASHRQGNESTVGRSAVPSGGSGRTRDSADRVRENRPINSGKNVTGLLDVNWTISFD
jgi:hypothetical protein